MTKYIPETAALDDVVMSGDELMDATSKNVRTFSTDHDTDCIFVGDGAATDGDTVYLPSLNGDAEVTKRQALVLGGFALHETLHKLLTDFRWFKRKASKWSPFTKAMHNAIEDVRIENGGRVLYNGLPKQVDKTAREVNRKFIDEVYPSDPDCVNDFGRIGPVAVTWAGRKALGYDDPSNEEALSLLPKDIRKRVERIAQQAMKLDHGVKGMGNVDQRAAFNGCKKGGTLAERITKQLEEELKEKAKQKGDGQSGDTLGSDPNGKQTNGQNITGDGKGNGTDGTAQHNSEQGASSQKEGQGGEDGSQEGGSADGSGDQETGASRGEGDDKSDGDSTDSDGTPTNGEQRAGGDISNGGNDTYGDVIKGINPIDPNIDAAASRIVGEINQTDPTGYRVWCPSADTLHTRFNDGRLTGKEHGMVGLGRKFYETSKKESGSALSTIRRKLERVLLEAKESMWENGKRSGRIDVQRNATKIVQLRPNVFRKRETELAVNSALSILIDQSGSMHRDDKIKLAQQTTIAILEALEPTQVPVEVIGHNTGNVPNRTERDRQRAQKARKATVNAAEFGRGRVTVVPDYGRYNKIDYFLYKSFEESLSVCREALGWMEHTTKGANADGDAIRFAAKRLLERQEPKKILFVLSDGAPAWYSSTHNKHQWTRDCVEWCKHQGIEVVGLGMLDGSVASYYPDYIVVNNIDDFAKTYINKIAKMLLGKGEVNRDVMKTGVRRGTKI